MIKTKNKTNNISRKLWQIPLAIFLTALLAITIAYAETSVIENNKGIIFMNNTITIFQNADIGFLGLEDKEEGYESPRIYANPLYGKVSSYQENKKCSELESDTSYSEREIGIETGKKYCIRLKDKYNTLDKDRQAYIDIKVTKLAEDWSSATIEWELEPLQDTTEETADSTQEEAKETEEPNQKQDNIPIPVYLSVDALLIALIALTIIKTRRYR